MSHERKDEESSPYAKLLPLTAIPLEVRTSTVKAKFGGRAWRRRNDGSGRGRAK